jgi:hypothetical protein
VTKRPQQQRGIAAQILAIFLLLCNNAGGVAARTFPHMEDEMNFLLVINSKISILFIWIMSR